MMRDLPSVPRATLAVRLAVVLFVLASVGMFGYQGLYLPLHATGYDFTGPYEAAYALAHHTPLPLYDVPLQRVFNARVLHLPDGPSDFRWTPQTAALLLPFGYLPYATARLIWLALAQIALLLSLLLLARCLTDRRDVASRGSWLPARQRRAFVLALGTLLCAAAWVQPVTDSLRLGQSTLLLLLGFVLLVYGETYRRPVLAGCGLGFTILLKLFPALLLVYYLWRGKYRLVLATLGFILLLTVLTLPITGGDLYRQFFAALLTYQDQPNAGPVNLSLYHAVIVGGAALLRASFEPTSGALVLGAKLVCAAVFGVFLLAHESPLPLARHLHALRTRLNIPLVASGALQPDVSTRTQRLGLGAWTVCTLLLVEPIDWIYYYLLLLIPLAWLLAEGADALSHARVGQHLPRRIRWQLGIGALGYLLATVPLPLDSRVAPPLGALYVVGICIRPVALVLLWGALWAMLAARQPARYASKPVCEVIHVA